MAVDVHGHGQRRDVGGALFNVHGQCSRTAAQTLGPDAQRITALLRDGGRISGYQLENGRILSKEEGITLAKEGGIRGVAVAERNGSEYLRTLPDEELRNLTQLPTIDPPASF